MLIQDGGREGQTRLTHDGAGGHHLGNDRRANFDNLQRGTTVTDGHAVARLQVGEDALTLHRDDLGRRSRAKGFHDLETVAVVQGDGAGAEGAGANLWSGDVHHDGDARCHGANTTEALDARRNVAVGHREAEDVNASLGEAAEDLVTL